MVVVVIPLANFEGQGHADIEVWKKVFLLISWGGRQNHLMGMRSDESNSNAADGLVTAWASIYGGNLNLAC